MRVPKVDKPKSDPFRLMTEEEKETFEQNKAKIKEYEKAKKVGEKEARKKTEKPKMASFLQSSKFLAEMVYTPGKGAFMTYNLETEKMEEKPEWEGHTPYNSEMVTKGVVLFPTKVGEYENERKLIEEIEGFIHKYVDVSPFFEKLAAYYVMFTWLYDNFNTLPYLRVLGDYGTGKTRFLQTVGSICYKPMFAGGATTPSPVFRIIEMFRGTLVLDEADFKASDDWAEIIKILNCGFQAGFPVLRTEEKDGQREPRAYDCYCPKILATRREFKDKALESRCLTERLTETTRHDIPLLLDKEFYTKSQELRNSLLRFRFLHFEKHEIDLAQQDKTIEKRLSQVIMSIYSIIDDKKVRDEIGEFLQEYNKKIIVDRGEQFEAMILEKIFEILNNRLDNETINENLYTKTVVNAVNEDIPKPEDKLTTHKIGWLLRKKLFLELVKDRKGRWIRWNTPMFFKHIKKYGICDDVTYVTFLRGTSDKVTSTKDTVIGDFRGKPPVASSQ